MSRFNELRDFHAAQFALKKYPIQNIETRKDFTQDVNFSRRMSHASAFQDGWDSCAAEYEKLLAEKDAKLAKAVEVLKFYSLKSNYSIVDEGRNYSIDYKCYELNEQTYADEELGTRARAALKEIQK